MVITVFGASGGIGKYAVSCTLEKGYIVKAYLGNPQKLTLKHENLTVVQGTLSDYSSVKRAVQGSDAVIWCVGISMKRHQDRAILERHKAVLNLVWGKRRLAKSRALLCKKKTNLWISDTSKNFKRALE